MSINSGNLGDFAKFEVKRKRHEVEVAEIREAREALGPELPRFGELLNRMVDPRFEMEADDKALYEKMSPVVIAIEKRVKAEEERWKVEHAEYMASKKSPCVT